MMSERERQLLRTLLAEPEELPSAFKDWLPRYLALHLRLNSSQVAFGGSSVVNSSLVPATGPLQDMPPGRELVNVKVTSAVTISATTEATANVVVTASAFTYDGASPVMVEGWFPDWTTGIGGNLQLVLWDDTAAASLGILATYTASASTSGPVHALCRLTPASGSRVYSIRAFRGAANGTVNAGVGGAGVKLPGFIRIVKV